jgi:hypothetical protein
VTRDGDSLKLVTVMPKADGSGEDRSEFTGKRLPPMPPAPDLSTVKFGEPVKLFDGQSLDGWRPVETDAINGWSVRDGLLCNSQGEEGKDYANLRTVAEFEDFMLHAETRVPKEGNSGIYLRGIYEVQVYDSYGKPLDSHNMGAIYSRIKPTVNAEKPAGEWQTFRHHVRQAPRHRRAQRRQDHRQRRPALNWVHGARRFCSSAFAHRVLAARWRLPPGPVDGEGARAAVPRPGHHRSRRALWRD